MARFHTDFSEFPTAAGLPAAFTSSGAPAVFSVVSEPGAPGGKVLRIAGSSAEPTQVLWNTPGNVLNGELYLRLSGGGMGAVMRATEFRYSRVVAADPAGVSAYRVDPDLPGASHYWVSDSNRYVGEGSYEVLVRMEGGRMRAMLWSLDGVEWSTWLYDSVDPNPAAATGLWGLLTVGNADVQFIGLGTEGDDAPRPEMPAERPRRPEPIATPADGSVALSASAWVSPTGAAQGGVRYRVAVSRAADPDRYLFDGDAVVLDTGWLSELGEYVWHEADPAEEYALEVTHRDTDDAESSPSKLYWFHVGQTIGRSGEGLPGFDLFGHRPVGCSEGVPAPDGGLVGSITVAGLPEGFGVLIERAGGVLYPTVENPFTSEEVPAAVPADASGAALIALPEDAVSLRVYGRPRRDEGNAAVQHYDLELYRDPLGSFVPEHGLLPGDEYLWGVEDPPEMAAPVTASVVSGKVRLSSAGYVGGRLHTASRWRIHETHASCPVLVYDSGWVDSLYAIDLTVEETGAPGWPVVLTVTHQDERGVEGPASNPSPYVVPWSLPQVTRRGVRQVESDFAGPLVSLEGATLAGRPDAIAEDYLTAFTVGPRRRSDTSAGLLDRVWKIVQENGDGAAYLYRADDDGVGYVLADEIFTEGDVVEVDLAFDQNGAAAVCAERPGTEGPEVFLYWYNPALAETVFEKIGDGRCPRIVMDTAELPELAELVVFYVSDAVDRVCYRRQSENFAVENLAPIVGVENVFLEDVALLPSRRLQVFGSVRDPTEGTYALGFLETTLYTYRGVESMSATDDVVDGYLRDVEILVYPEEHLSVADTIPSGSLRENVMDLSETTDQRITPEQARMADTVTAGALTSTLLDLSSSSDPKIVPEQARMADTVTAGNMVQVVIEYPERAPERAAIIDTIVSGVLENV
jgi:hypothetical protein